MVAPGIYDWPYSGSLEPSTALPVLNWHSGSAREVAREVRVEWDRIAATKGLLTVLLETEVSRVTYSADKLLLTLSQGQQIDFDIVVLAIGFGLEGAGLGQIGYWNDSDGLDNIAEGSSVLISGFGDGGLADVLRLCLPNIRQASLVELVRHVPAEVRRELIEKDDSLRADGAGLDKFYSELRVKAIVQSMENSVPAFARVTLSGRDNLYGTGSAILNRFLVSQLRQARGEQSFELAEEVIPESLSELPDGNIRVELGNDRKPREFQHVVLRWGPQPTYRRLHPLGDWKVGDERRKHWYDMPQSLDRTRVPFSVRGEPRVESGRQPQDFLAYESSHGDGVSYFTRHAHLLIGLSTRDLRSKHRRI